jgi:hypothetical protein
MCLLMNRTFLITQFYLNLNFELGSVKLILENKIAKLWNYIDSLQKNMLEDLQHKLRTKQMTWIPLTNFLFLFSK